MMVLAALSEKEKKSQKKKKNYSNYKLLIYDKEINCDNNVKGWDLKCMQK